MEHFRIIPNSPIFNSRLDCLQSWWQSMLLDQPYKQARRPLDQTSSSLDWVNPCTGLSPFWSWLLVSTFSFRWRNSFYIFFDVISKSFSYRPKKAATFSVQWTSEAECLSVTRVRGQDVSIKFEKKMKNPLNIFVQVNHSVANQSRGRQLACRSICNQESLVIGENHP